MINSSPDSYTKTEIFGQPTLWSSIYQLLLERKVEINKFLKPVLEVENLQIILTGAGSSAFIGEAAAGLVQKNIGCTTKAIATTDIVTHPKLHFQSNIPTLLISFARSGSSPESVETVDLADKHCKKIFHLMITCNREGELAKYGAKNKTNSFVLLLPEVANDKSLAMTGSFTSMLLSMLLINHLDDLAAKDSDVSKMIWQGELLLRHANTFREIAAKDFKRVVFLGSGPMLGIARECHLKLQELTDGQIICKHDSFLGFRHGPRAVTDETTLLVYLFSPDSFVYQYELDLALSLAKDERKLDCLSIGRPENKALKSCLNVDLDFDDDEELNIVPAGLVGQMLGFYKSIELGLNPDNPSTSGAINRVVQGVKIYNREEKKNG